MFKAKAVVLATGGIGRAFRITSNSWEYTGRRALARLSRRGRPDGHGVRAVPPDREWCGRPSVRGILVTEGVRGEGGVLRNSERQALHVRRHPGQLQESDRRQRGGGLALHVRATRTRAARPSCSPAITWPAASMREVKAGPRQPARRRVPRHRVDQGKASPERRGAHQARSCLQHVSPVQAAGEPRHHHQSRWRSGPTTHYIMGGVRVDGDTQMSTVPGSSPPGSSGGGLHGANRLGGNSLSDLLVFGKRAGEHAAKYAKANGGRPFTPTKSRQRPRTSALIRRSVRERHSKPARVNPYKIQQDLQEHHAEPGGDRACRGGDAAKRWLQGILGSA